ATCRARTGLSPLSLHDALPIWAVQALEGFERALGVARVEAAALVAHVDAHGVAAAFGLHRDAHRVAAGGELPGVVQKVVEQQLRSEEHTSELRHVKISYAVFCL